MLQKSTLDTSADFIHAFFQIEEELKADIVFLKECLNTDGMLWVSWPKGKSSIATDLNREKVREIGLKAGLIDIKVCTIDDNWSALKFVYRRADR